MLVKGSQVKPYLDILYRRRWYIAVPLALGLAVGAVLLTQLPKVYQAQTTILVTPQRVPEEFVQSTVTSRLEERVATLTVQILSRSYLETIAREFELVDADPTEAELSQACAFIAGKVFITYDTKSKTPAWFKISVDDQSPRLAAGIANRLASLFIEQNTRLRAGQATTALETAQKWLADIKLQLDRKEAQLAAYRQGKLWELPEQLPANMQLLGGTETRIQTLGNDISMRNERIAQLRIQAQMAAVSAVPGVIVTSDPAQQRLAALQLELNQLLNSKTEEHPDVRAKRNEIAQHLRLNPHLGAPPAPGAPPKPMPTVYDAEIAKLEAEIRNLEAQRGRLMGETDTYRARISSAPTRQQEMELLTRDLETLRSQYNTWLAKENDAKRSLDMEVANQGEQFQVQDQASIPTSPYKPDPVQVLLFGLLAGLGVGVGGSILLEFMDNSIRTEEEFQSAFPDLPLLASIPDLDRGSSRGGGGGKKRSSAAKRAAALVVACISFLG